MTSPRVLMVTGAYYPELAGGSLQCRSLVLMLRDRVRFSVLTTTAEPRAPKCSEVDGVLVYRIYVDPHDWWTKIVAGWRLIELLPRLVRDSDIFHFHGFTEKTLLLLAAAKFCGRGTIGKLSSLGWDDPIAIRRRPLGRILAAAQSRLDRLIAINPGMTEQCRRAGVPQEAVVAIPNGVDAVRFAPIEGDARGTLRDRLGLPAHSCIVAFVGFWSREKGPDLLFAAWQQARRQTNVDVALLFIGSTSPTHPEVSRPLVEQVRREIDADGLGARVFFVERTDDVASYLQASDVFVLPSSREGLSNALLEAMSTGLACVCADIPGATDAVVESGVNGWRVPPGDIQVLTDVLAMLFRDMAARRAAGARARATVIERYTIQSVADRYLALYGEILNRGARPLVRSRRPTRRAAWSILIAATFILGLAWGSMIPPFEGPDESAHYTRLVARGLAGSADRPLRLATNPVFRHLSGQRARVNMFMHGRIEGADRGNLTRMYVVRGLTLAIWIPSLLLVFETARLVFGRNDVALLTAGLSACLPGVSFMLSKVHPAAMSVFLGSLVYWTMTSRAMGRLDRPLAWMLGLAVVAVTPFSDRSAYFLCMLVPVGLVVTEATWRARLLAAMTWLTLALAVVRFHLFADLQRDFVTALGPFRPSYPYAWWPSDPPSYLAFEFAPKLFLGFCGWLGQQSVLLPALVYAMMAAATLVALYGLALHLSVTGLRNGRRAIATVFLAGICLSFVPILYTNTLLDREAAASGFWLYASLAPIMIGFVQGCRSASAVARRSPHWVAVPAAASAVLLAILWASGIVDTAQSIRFNYTGAPDHLIRTISYAIVLLAAIAGAVALSAWRRWSPRPPGQDSNFVGLFAGACVTNLLLLLAVVAPLYWPLDGDGLATLVREEAANGDIAPATELYRLAALAHPESTALRRLAIEGPRLGLKGYDDPLLAGLRARLRQGGKLKDPAELMALARAARTTQSFDADILRAIADHIEDSAETREPSALISAESEGRARNGRVAEVIRAAGGSVALQDMHGDAKLEGYTVSRNASGRHQVTVYFRPLRSWSGRHLWMHAYPAGSHDYMIVSPVPPAFGGWKPDELAWETFPLPTSDSYVLYVGVEVGNDLGPAYLIGNISD